MTADLDQLLSPPFETLAVLAAGYAAYRLAFSGRDLMHHGVDTALLTVVYAAIAKLVMQVSEPALPTELAAAAGFVVALIVAAFWRRFGSRWIVALQRKSRISFSDGMHSAWDTVRTNEAVRPTQLIVRRTGGVMLMCDELAKFQHENFGPCIYGDDGSIALYVTHQKADGESDWEQMDAVVADQWGALLTYVPASEIASIYLRS